jgi:L-rhamnose isomerase
VRLRQNLTLILAEATINTRSILYDFFKVSHNSSALHVIGANNTSKTINKLFIVMHFLSAGP